MSPGSNKDVEIDPASWALNFEFPNERSRAGIISSRWMSHKSSDRGPLFQLFRAITRDSADNLPAVAGTEKAIFSLLNVGCYERRHQGGGSHPQSQGAGNDQSLLTMSQLSPGV